MTSARTDTTHTGTDVASDAAVSPQPVTARTEQAADLAIAVVAAALHLPTIRAEEGRIAPAASKERLTHRAFLAEVLTAELDDRDSRRRLVEAKISRWGQVKPSQWGQIGLSSARASGC
jgi:hypothetical protein